MYFTEIKLALLSQRVNKATCLKNQHQDLD